MPVFPATPGEDYVASDENVTITLSDSATGEWQFTITILDDDATEHLIECFAVRVTPTVETKDAFGEVITIANREQDCCIMDDDGSYTST